MTLVPTLVMVGEHEGDPNVAMTHRASSELLAKAILGVQFVVLPGQKHNYFASAPEATHRVIRGFYASESNCVTGSWFSCRVASAGIFL